MFSSGNFSKIYHYWVVIYVSKFSDGREVWERMDLSICMAELLCGPPETITILLISYQIRSVAQSCPTLCDPMNRTTPGLPVHHQLPEFTQTHLHRVSDAIQPPHPPSCPSPSAPNPSQHQSLFQWVNSLHEVAKVLEFQLLQYKIRSFKRERFYWHKSRISLG